MCSSLPPRYEVRVLGPEHTEWVGAICAHTNMFFSPLWPVLYPENRTERTYQMFSTGHYMMKHQIDSGFSLGIFDKEYQFKRPESAATGGKLYWDLDDASATERDLENQMDFPLVSVAMAYDGIDELDMEKMKPVIGTLPLFATAYKALNELDTRDPASWKPISRGQVLMRNATSTRGPYEGRGLMRKLAEEMMKRSATLGFRGIQIETGSEAVLKVWSTPPAQFNANVIGKVHTTTYEEKNESGETVYPFRPANLNLGKVYVDLKTAGSQ
ncbi:hypothetical protein N7481_012956 [Penicillium waksmanii]|uniref:uncharacterized protein n=1 Tax=Penicillium waksmanii TaxID=69791 RepID=UPI00254828B7|nr:uncharacterized protein N7481_012956 [Penicillium waksmanii]KAJ5966242.1 hypothetical protein N7481_012956 [Penicillium waksmanii]